MRLPDLLEIYDAQGVQRCGGCDLTYDDVRCTLVLCPDSLDVQLLAQTTPLRFVRLRWAIAASAKRREPVRIYDLAVNLVTLSGLKPGRDIEIKVTGLRPGEKMYEELLMDTEKLLPTENSQIRISTGEADDLSTMKEKLGKLEACLDGTNYDIKAVLADVVPTYHPQYND